MVPPMHLNHFLFPSKVQRLQTWICYLCPKMLTLVTKNPVKYLSCLIFPMWVYLWGCFLFAKNHLTKVIACLNVGWYYISLRHHHYGDIFSWFTSGFEYRDGTNLFYSVEQFHFFPHFQSNGYINALDRQRDTREVLLRRSASSVSRPISWAGHCAGHALGGRSEMPATNIHRHCRHRRCHLWRFEHFKQARKSDAPWRDDVYCTEQDAGQRCVLSRASLWPCGHLDMWGL